ncbi:uncharacterized protein LOC110854612 [Folsomia candida]|uniref:uncharacterized protein LOC110854612 n=1 Tax=Folsomia candida TaxID=158441 RepID=UPI000B8F2DBD|nr:uncharacterized protein LOC110854612 [Folsomia candida]XP_035711348.1 uncharacterized protein LOC110854612 [Folsomia candida]
MMSVISRMVGIRVVEHPGNSIVYSAGCVGTLPLNLSLSFDQTAAILGREGPLSRSNITTRSCYNADLAIQGFNLTAVFTPFDKNCPVIGQIVAAEFSKYDAAILTELRGSGEDENKNYGAGQPWPYKIYPCILSNEDGDAITKIIGSPLANEKTYTVRFEDTIPSNIFEKLFDWVGLTGGICILVVAGGIAFLLALYLLACLIPILCLILKILMRCVIVVLEFIFYSPVWVVKMGVATSVKIRKGCESISTTCISRWRKVRILISQSDPQKTCSICLEDCTVQSVNTRVLQCRHIFHANCIREWLSTSRNCPLCRTAVNERTPLLRT